MIESFVPESAIFIQCRELMEMKNTVDEGLVLSLWITSSVSAHQATTMNFKKMDCDIQFISKKEEALLMRLRPSIIGGVRFQVFVKWKLD